MIRPMAKQDIKAVARFHHAAWMDAYRDLLPQETLQKLTPQHFQHTWEKILEDDHRVNLVAVQETMPVGYASYRQWKKSKRWELLGLYVDPASMHKGCGTALLNAVKKSVQQKNARLLFVWVIKGNQRAIQFYQKNRMKFTRKTRRITKEKMTFQEIQLIQRFDQNRER